MAKLVETINDFSGGVVKGYSAERLKNNQLQECKNFVSDGVGTLQGVPTQESASTLDISADFPSWASKNIHAWSTDTNLVTSGASQYSSTPSVNVVDASIRARVIFYMSMMDSDSDGRVTLVDTLREGSVPVFSNYLASTNYIFDKNGGHPNRIHGLSVKIWEREIHANNTNTTHSYKTDHINWVWNTHAEMESFIGAEGSSRFGVSFNDVEPTSPPDHSNNYDDFNWTQTNSGDNSTPDSNYNSGNYMITAIKASEFYDTTWPGPDTTFQPYVYRSMMTFDHYGTVSMHLHVYGNEERMAPSSGNLTINSQSIPRKNLNSSSRQSNNMGGQTFKFLHTDVEEDYSTFGVQLGQYSKWAYNFEINSPTNTATYTLSIDLYTNVAQTTKTTVTATIDSELGQSALNISSSLVNQLVQKVQDTLPQHSINIERIDSRTMHIFQDENTPTAYGFEDLTSTVTNASSANIGDLTSGQSFQNLIAISNLNTQTSIYSIENDNWLDYSIDLRSNTSQALDCKLNYTDAEGYLKVSDADFHAGTQPKWFGYLNLNNHVYLDNTFTADGEFYASELSPVPYISTPSSGVHNGDYSHHVSKKNNLFRTQEVNDDIFPVHCNSTGGDAPQHTGLKLVVDFIDGTHASHSKMDGLFMKDEVIEFYYTYTYYGGAISEPQAFKNNAGNTISFKPGDDNASLGLMVKMGAKMITGDGTGLHNTRLKSIEIWGRFTKYDSVNIYQLAELDLIKGWKSSATGVWKNFFTAQNNGIQAYTTGNPNTTSGSAKDYIIYKAFPPISFFSKYGIKWDNPIGWGQGSGWKTACVFNRRAYYGNVRIKNKDGTLTYFPDGIVKSPVGMYDSVSIDNLIEATINDGDEVTCLRVAGNKLCQFKENSLTIMGVKTLENGQSTEIIEQTINHCGVSGDNQVTSTPYGIMWVSRSGLWIYNGTEVRKLTENLEGSTISKQNWENYYTARTHIGYDAYWNQAHICQDTQNNPKTLIYNFNTRGFSESDKLYASTQKTGFVNNPEGHLLWAQHGTGTGSQSQDNNSNNPQGKDKSVAQEQFDATNWEPNYSQ